MNKKYTWVGIATFGLLVIGIITNSTLVSAHRDGCHRWHSCPSDSGSYVCGDLGYTSECGSTSTVTPTPALIMTPKTPVRTSSEEIKDSVLKYKTIKKNNPNQYVGYKRILTKGVDGVTTTKVVIELTDGVEQSRSAPTSTTKQAAVDEVIEVGVREKPAARFTKIRDMTGGFMNANKGKYIVEGFGPVRQKVTLYQNGQKVGTTKTNQDGYFEFNKLAKGDKPTWLVLYDKNGDKGKKLSEKTRATFTTKELITEFMLLRTKAA